MRVQRVQRRRRGGAARASSICRRTASSRDEGEERELLLFLFLLLLVIAGCRCILRGGRYCYWRMWRGRHLHVPVIVRRGQRYGGRTTLVLVLVREKLALGVAQRAAKCGPGVVRACAIVRTQDNAWRRRIVVVVVVVIVVVVLDGGSCIAFFGVIGPRRQVVARAHVCVDLCGAILMSLWAGSTACAHARPGDG